MKKEKKEERKVFSIKENIFGQSNPNADIFTIETEEGRDEEDNMCSMIGDAMMAHLQRLSPSQRQCWEHYVLMGGKNLFDFIPSPTDNDRDPHGLKVEDIEGLEEDIKSVRPDLASLPKEALEEAIEQERERRGTSEDVMDRTELLIPYQEWAENPGMFKHFDMPSTPKNLAIFCGNTSQIFYDEFPEGHPDSKIINDFLVRVNRDVDELTENYGKWICEWLDQQNFKLPYAQKVLVRLMERLVEGEKNPEEVTRLALTLIDQDWQKSWIQNAKVQIAEDPIRQLLERKSEEWAQMHKEGLSVLPFVKSFGQVMYGKFRTQIKKSHWAFYKAVKAKYAPAVILRGLDVNTCRLGDLERVLGIPRQVAVDIFVNRPFQSSAELLEREVEYKAVVMKDKDGKEHVITPARKEKKGWLKKDLLSEKGNIEELYSLIRSKAEEAASKRNMKALTSLSSELVARQKDSRDNFTSKEWGALWTFYRTTKSDILSSMKGTPE